MEQQHKVLEKPLQILFVSLDSHVLDSKYSKIMALKTIMLSHGLSKTWDGSYCMLYDP